MKRLRFAWPYGVVTALPLLLFGPFLLGLRVLYWGTIEFQFYPWHALAADALRAGHLPLWNPLLGNGTPLLANYQSAVLYPPNWLALDLPLDLVQPWLAALHLAWAGAGMVALTRRLKLPAISQAISGLAFGMSQYLVSRVSFLSINATVAWLPWIVCLVEYQVQLGLPGAVCAPRARLRAALLLAACVAAQLLAGHAQTTWYTLLLAAAWGGWRLLSLEQAGARARARTVLWCVAAIGAGGLMAAIQLLPTAELLRQSPRASAAAFDFVMTYSFSPWRLLTLVAPDLLGNPARGQFFGYGNYWEDAIYVGLLPLLLAMGMATKTAVQWFRRRDARVGDGARGLPTFLIALAALSLLLGLGRNTPVFPFLYWHIPTFNLFQAPTRIMVWFEFALALLAGLGAAAWKPPQGWALYWTHLGAAGAAAMAVVGLIAWLRISPSTQTGLQIQTMGRALALAGLALFLCALLSLTLQAKAGRRWAVAVVAFVALDLWFANAGLNPGALPDLYRQPPVSAATVGAALGGHRLLYFPNDEDTVKYDRFVSFKSFGPADLAYGARDSLLADGSARAGLASANNFEPLVSARYAAFMDVISSTRSGALLRLMDVALIASPAPLSLEHVADSASGGVRFYRAPGVPQRVWQPRHILTVAGPAEAQAALADPNFDPAETLILEVDDAANTAAATPFRPSAAATTIPVTFEQAGWLLLADTDYPGWVASVDGQPVLVRHGDLAFRAVAVPAGAHTVVFDYEPTSLRAGLVLTLIGLGLVLGMAAWSADWGRGWVGGRPNAKR